MSKGGGNHNVKVNGARCSVPSDVCAVGRGRVVVWMIIGGLRVDGNKKLFFEGFLSGDPEDNFGKGVADGIMSLISVRSRRAL